MRNTPTALWTARGTLEELVLLAGQQASLTHYDPQNTFVAAIHGAMDAMFELSRYDAHREAKGKYQNWYDGQQIVVSEIKKSYGDGAIETIAEAQLYLMQNETVFYATVSSDGILAGPNGDMTWAEKWLSSGEDYGYCQLVSSCSAMLMGSKTFDFELAAICNQDQILPTYVLTTNPQRNDGVHGDVKLVAGDVSAVVDRITDTHPGRLFVVGGADVAKQLLEAGKLDVVVLTTTPDELKVDLKLWATDSWREGFTLVTREEFASGLSQET